MLGVKVNVNSEMKHMSCKERNMRGEVTNMSEVNNINSTVKNINIEQ